ncbi:MAG: hypothetical protein KJ041_09475, partial [Gammaproteobacteria bacterium]|nr:hypothetical protein [Gammaproteobacteria bacterium]
LASTPDRVLGFGAATQHGVLVLIAGNEVGLAGGLLQRPMLWAGSPAGPWRSVELPVPAELAPEPGQLSLASAVTCPEAGETCWVAGWARGRPLAWPVTVGSGRMVVGDATVLAGRAPAGANPVALVTLADGLAAVLTNAAEPTLQVVCPGGRRTLPAPPGTAVALTSAGGGLYAVAGGSLWRFDAPRC